MDPTDNPAVWRDVRFDDLEAAILKFDAQVFEQRGVCVVQRGALTYCIWPIEGFVLGEGICVMCKELRIDLIDFYVEVKKRVDGRVAASDGEH